MNGIYTQATFPDAKFLRAGCACGDASHDHNIKVEADECGVSVALTSDLQMCEYETEWHGNFFQKALSRLRVALIVLATGRYTVSSTFYFEKEEHVEDYTQAIRDAFKHVKYK